MSGARNEMIDLEEGTEAVLKREQERFRALARQLHTASGGTLDLVETVKGCTR